MDNFSDIPLGWLRNLVYAFNRKTKAIKNVDTLHTTTPSNPIPDIHIHSKNI